MFPVGLEQANTGQKTRLRTGGEPFASANQVALVRSKVALVLLFLHGAGFIVIDEAASPPGTAGGQRLLNNLSKRRCTGKLGGGDRPAPESLGCSHR